MGTNYYLEAEPCAHCGRGDTQVHIGKSSVGWPFLFAPNAERDISSWRDWRKFLSQPINADRIKSEYGDRVTLAAFICCVEGRPVTQGKLGGHDRVDDEGYSFSISEDFSCPTARAPPDRLHSPGMQNK